MNDNAPTIAPADITNRYMEILGVRNRCEDYLDTNEDDGSVAMMLVLAEEELERLAAQLPF